MSTNESIGLATLDEVLNNQSSHGRPIKTFVGYNSGNRTFTVILSLFELQEFTQVANQQSDSPYVAQRKLDLPHALEIGKYLLKSLLFSVERRYIKRKTEIPKKLAELQDKLGRQPYISIPPLVASFRKCQPNGTNLRVEPLLTETKEVAAFRIFVGHGDIFWIIDGQHRRKGVQLLFEFLDYVRTYRKYPSKSSLYPGDSKKELTYDELQIWNEVLELSRECSVTLEVHLGLDMDQERQLFHDLNNLAKKVEKSLALQFDNSNPVNQFIKESLMDDLFHNESFAIHEKDKVNWDETEPGLTRKDLVGISALLFLNKTNINNAAPIFVSGKSELARYFWEMILKIPGIKNESSRQVTVAAQPVVLKAISKLFFDFFFGRNLDWNNELNQNIIKDKLLGFDFSHSNKIWNYYNMTDKEREDAGIQELDEYLPNDSIGNRDLGSYDSNGHFRFGAKHNDIYPIIGDMIRWKLGLPKRKKDSE